MCETFRQIHLDPDEGMRLFSTASPRLECTCRSFSRSSQYEPLSILHFRRVFRRRHFASCPKSKTSDDSLEYTMKIIPPSWLLSHTIHLSLQIRMTAIKGNFSIAPVVFGASRLVDQYTSPAFQLLNNFDRDYRALRRSPNTGGHGIGHGPGMVKAMESSLRDLFDSGLSSPLDEDETGRTILYVCRSNSHVLANSITLTLVLLGRS